MEKQPLFKTENLTKVFGQTVAVDKVSIEIFAGEIHGLIGENGSGKSTITSIANGIQPPSSGKMFFDGKEYAPKNQIDANERGVSIIVQEMSTIDDLTVAENIFFGNENLFAKGGFIDKKAMNKKAAEYLKEYGLERIRPADDISHYMI
jgi:ribose transport system ATP-binding protein